MKFMKKGGLYIESISIKSYKCFDDIEIDCMKDKSKVSQWTVFIGNNNTGKTNLLKAIANLRAVKLTTPSPKDNSVVIIDSKERHYAPALFFDKDFSDKKPTSSIKCKTTEFIHSNWGFDEKGFSITQNAGFIIYGYGVSRYPATTTNLQEGKSEDCITLFDHSSKLINIEEWLMQLDYAAKNNEQKADNRLYKIEEVLSGKLFPEIEGFDFISNSETLENQVRFNVSGGESFKYDELGFGYQSLLGWIIDLCKKMFERYPNLDNPLKGSAIVLIDELDLHLHPTWQRNIIQFLSETFPNTQFIATTHSPLVIQSMEDVSLYTLHRDEEDKVIFNKSNQRNFVGWTVEEILEETMMLDSNVRTDLYNKYIQGFNKAVIDQDRSNLEKHYKLLDNILHSSNQKREILKLQVEDIDE